MLRSTVQLYALLVSLIMTTAVAGHSAKAMRETMRQYAVGGYNLTGKYSRKPTPAIQRLCNFCKAVTIAEPAALPGVIADYMTKTAFLAAADESPVMRPTMTTSSTTLMASASLSSSSTSTPQSPLRGHRSNSFHLSESKLQQMMRQQQDLQQQQQQQLNYRAPSRRTRRSSALPRLSVIMNNLNLGNALRRKPERDEKFVVGNQLHTYSAQYVENANAHSDESSSSAAAAAGDYSSARTPHSLLKMCRLCPNPSSNK